MDLGTAPQDHPETEWVSTGALPSETEVQALVKAGYERFLPVDEGAVADYIPALAAASPTAFGVCVAGVGGRLFSIGDADQEFAIQSISKLFVFALVCHTLGHDEARRKLGVNSTGLPFNSVMAIELNVDRTMNPLVNAGAIATTSLVPGTTAEEKFESIVAGMSRFAGRRLVMDEDVYASEAATNKRNQGIAHLLDGYGHMYCDPDLATDVYTRQCSLRVSARDLAIMGATLANGGVNPVTGEQAIDTRVLPPGTGGAGHRRPLRGVRPMAVRRRPARQERSQRRHRDGVARQRERRHVFPAARCGRQQRPGPADHQVPVGGAGAQSLCFGSGGLTWIPRT